MPATVLHDAEQIVTLRGPATARRGHEMSRLGLLERASLIIDEKGTIAWVGDATSAASMAPASADWVDCRDHVLMPGLVDAHTHAVWAGHRMDELEARLAGADYEALFAAGGGILSSVRSTRAADEDQLVTETMARLHRMRACGTTSFEIKSGYGLDVDTELRQLRVIRRLRDDHGFRIHATCLAAHAIPAEFRGSERDRQHYVERICHEILPAVVREGLADSCDVFCDRGAFSATESRAILRRARELGLSLRVHANELGHTGGATLAAELGAKTADHLLALDDDERAALRDAGVIAMLLPGTSLVLGKPFADGRALIDGGVPVAVATDCNPGSCAIENLALVLGLACYGNRLSIAEAICATTHNAAVSLGWGNRLGRLEAGLDADILVLSVPDHRALVYHAGSPLQAAVYQRGVRVFPPRHD